MNGMYIYIFVKANNCNMYSVIKRNSMLQIKYGYRVGIIKHTIIVVQYKNSNVIYVFFIRCWR